MRVGIVAPHRQLTHHLGAPYHLLTTTIPGLLDRESTIPDKPLAASILAQQTLLCACRLQPIVRESLLYLHHYPFGAFFSRNSRTACWIKKLTVSPSFLASFLSASICRALIRTALSFLTITRMCHTWATIAPHYFRYLSARSPRLEMRGLRSPLVILVAKRRLLSILSTPSP